MKANKERAAAVDSAVSEVRTEKDRSESALMEEIARLRAEKDRAEMALSKITMLAPIWSVSDESDGSKDGDDDHDDGVSKLTFLEHYDDDGDAEQGVGGLQPEEEG